MWECRGWRERGGVAGVTKNFTRYLEMSVTQFMKLNWVLIF